MRQTYSNRRSSSRNVSRVPTFRWIPGLIPKFRGVSDKPTFGLGRASMPTVLIVEDELMIADMVTETLVWSGYDDAEAHAAWRKQSSSKMVADAILGRSAILNRGCSTSISSPCWAHHRGTDFKQLSSCLSERQGHDRHLPATILAGRRGHDHLP
jgi:hypothetical protein